MAMTSSRGRTSDARTNQLDHMLSVLKRRGWRVRFKYVSLPLPLHVVLSIAWIKSISLAGREAIEGENLAFFVDGRAAGALALAC